MRSLALAQALAARGAVCAFMCGPQGVQIVERYGGGQFEVISCPLSRAATAFDALVIDDYQCARLRRRRFGPSVPSSW